MRCDRPSLCGQRLPCWDEASGVLGPLRLAGRGPALPHGWPEPARRHRHLLEYRPSRRSGQTAETRRSGGRPRAPGPHLTPWVGPRPAHRRIPVAKAPIAPLAYDSAPYLNRPNIRRCRGMAGGASISRFHHSERRHETVWNASRAVEHRTSSTVCLRGASIVAGLALMPTSAEDVNFHPRMGNQERL